MKAASLNELKQELRSLSPQEMLELCMKLAKYKKENKELLTYLLFEASDEPAYIRNVKELIDEQFLELNRSHIYLAKKTLRKVLRTTHKYIKYSQSKSTEVELLIYYCRKFRNSGIRYRSYPVLSNMYDRQIEKIRKSLSSLHEDLQYDFKEDIRELDI
jgi:hypothetical protein